ncbi:uncharacterized protein [Nicotiana sylvestris]|uniref:Uncharacterized protein LOC104242173 n=1 Tax=Nicotiana sylvestris TaxID=4096 RepID=A0A1U7XU23_NICSY|nr:PREDICTED: uncharacterized protein LOC104242173 [Nicotiana sylvestris]
MGKLQGQRLPLQQNIDGSRTFFCRMGLSRIFSFKCIVVLVLSIALFLSALFWIIPHRSKPSGFDAKEAIKLASTTQAYFRLEKPVSDIVPHIARLEYDILEEIAIPGIKVAVLSVHGAGVANQTDIIFGFLPDPVDSSISPVSLSLLKSALLDLYLRDTNLTLTSSIFGRLCSFEVLKCPGGITMILERLSILNLPDILFNFTLHNSTDEIRENFIELKEQLNFYLRLRTDEHVFLQVTNKIGSTKDPPVIVEASLYSDSGRIPAQRLQQLAQIIMGSVPATNLGLDHSIFGKVKQVRLSSFLNRTGDAAPPTLPPAPTPAPSPNEPLWPSPSPSPAVSSSPAPLPNCHRFLRSHDKLHCSSTRGKEPSGSPSPMADPPSPVTNTSPRSSSSRIVASPSPYAPSYPPKLSPGLKLSPGPSPLSAESYGSGNMRNVRDDISRPLMSSSISSSSSSFAPDFSYKELCLFWLFGLTVLHILN